MEAAEANSRSTASRTSLRGRIATRMARVMFKFWAKGDPATVVRRARRVFGLPDFAVWMYSHGVAIEQVGAQDSSGHAEHRVRNKKKGTTATGNERELKTAEHEAVEDRIEGEIVRGEWIRPRARPVDGNVVLYLHGGGYVSCTPQTHRPITTTLARLTRRCVFSLDYRLAPEHPFPAAVDDAARSFRWLVASGVAAEKIAVAGDSAGGGLALAMMLRLRSLGHALPACGICLSPWVDLTGTDRYQNSGFMFQSSDIATYARLYLSGAPADVPEASPLFADLGGLPPLLIQVSSSELLLDDALRLYETAKRSGVASTLSVYPGMPHVWQIITPLIPEAKTAFAEIVGFMDKTWQGATQAATEQLTKD